MRKLFAVLSMVLVVTAPLAVEAAPFHGFEANAPRGEDASAPRADRESNAPRSPEPSVPDSVDQGNPAP